MSQSNFNQDIVNEQDITAANLTATAGVVTVTLTTSGAVILANLPTEDPSVAGQLWSNSNVLTVSTGA